MCPLKPHKLINELASPLILGPLLTVIGLFGLYFSTIVRNPYTILYPSAIIVGTIIFYAISQHPGELTEINAKSIYSKIIAICFLLVVSVLTVWYYTVGFSRTSSVFYLTFFLYILTGLYILTHPRTVFALLVILVAGLVNRFTAYYNSVLYSGVDVYSHSRWVGEIAASGSLREPELNKYFYSPFYHILAAVGELIYGIPTRDALALTTLLAVSTIPIIAVYLITIHFWNQQIGLFAGLLYASSDHAIRWGIDLIPTSLGVVFFALLLLSLIKYTISRKTPQYALFIIFIIALSFTQQVSLFIGVTAVGGFTVAFALYRLKLSTTVIRIGLVAGIITFVDFIVTKYSGPRGDISFLDAILGTLIFSLFERAGTQTRAEVSFPVDGSFSPSGAAALTVDHITGSAILLTLAVCGALYWLTNRRSNNDFFAGVSLSVTVTLLLAVTLIGPVIGLRNLLPGRWWAFTYIPLAVLAAPVFFIAINKFLLLLSIERDTPKFVIVSAVLFIFLLPYIALMGGNWVGAFDDPLYDDAYGAEKMKITESEKHAFEHSIEYSDEIIVQTDRRASEIFSRYYGSSSQILSIDYGNPTSLQQPSIIVNRSYIHEKQSGYRITYEDEPFTVHGAFPLEKIPDEDKSRVYATGEDNLIYYES